MLLHKYFDFEIRISENDAAEKELFAQIDSIEELPEILDNMIAEVSAIGLKNNDESLNK